MDQTTTQVLSILIILLALVVIAVLSRRRRRPFPLRPIPAYARIPDLVGESVESGRPLHLSLGSAGIGGESTVLAVASAELAYQVTQRAATGDTPPILTLTDSTALPLAQDTLRRAYQSRALGTSYRYSNARWFPYGSRSLAFAAAVGAMMDIDNVSANVLAGSYGPELALIMDASFRQRVPVIAVSDQLEGQAVAFALADAPLIGEEVFAAGSYLDGSTHQMSESAAIDLLRWLLVLAMLAGLVATIASQGG
ncbi:MAG: DUF6754 domain-containing protein [Phototrophicaceae bacterium]